MLILRSDFLHYLFVSDKELSNTQLRLAMAPSLCSSSNPKRRISVLLSILTRKKTLDEAHLEDTKLARCLATVDLVALGVGSTLGAGVYVIAGEVAQKTTGPAVVVSFLIAAAASVLAGLCYAEFGARVPKSGSAYVYSYVSVGELMAFVIGWNLILEYVIGTASVARAWSQNFDSLVGGKVIGAFRASMPMSLQGIAEYPDFFALGIILLLTVVISLGVKESAWINKIFTLVNLVVLSLVFVSGLWLSDVANWQAQPGDNGTIEFANRTFSAEAVGDGGFLPFGFKGVISGAGTCFYAFIGFDAIATTGEEVKNPQRAIPISIILSLSICFVVYFCLSAVLTLMLPYFALDPLAPLPAAFAAYGWKVANYAIAVGAVCALSTSLLGSMIPLPRIVYAMAADGLIFRFLAKVQPRLATPMIATLITGCMAGIMACLFELKELVDMMSIGTLLAYTLVALSVLILRGTRDQSNELTETLKDYKDCSSNEDEENGQQPAALIVDESSSVRPKNGEPSVDAINAVNKAPSFRDYIRCSIKVHAPDEQPSLLSETVTRGNSAIFMASAAALAFILERCSDQLSNPGVAVAAALSILVCLACIVSLRMQPQSAKKVAFKVPGVPFLPCLSILVNLYLMMALPNGTWLRFLVWMTIGFLIYFAYGLLHSTEHRLQTKPKLSRLRQQGV
ncbi:hypothetical protein BOX15_Mlig033100g1 [Macrostomum lignano]|uniref:Cationic amino acid transporter C-terminal domain-containing protein n=1 Tax=Macrostomum lignano TaxID=282301 RepID=A0A267GS55_9PLAT|nr:hypothetical protein BOX15_Mlig033100g1 [Macrostomum lignano]